MSQDAFKLESSVYHHSKKTCSCSSYVSISASKDKAINFASKQTAKELAGVYEVPWKEINDVPVEEWLNEYILD
ncbi:hypothetical protein BM221_001508 [Beauveria bassiana]|uniref:Uncharacterized protein n=1 Tax=Beauveria bassiana TaxID=176275 RepID=A0A2N6NVY3_BEABA|nr:hypothetical protein BM221_001508 [Beauveria bassiana]